MKKVLLRGLLSGVGILGLIASAKAADRRVVTMNTEQIFGAIDPV
jgi:hypothetical protein